MWPGGVRLKEGAAGAPGQGRAETLRVWVSDREGFGTPVVCGYGAGGAASADLEETAKASVTHGLLCHRGVLDPLPRAIGKGAKGGESTW